MNNSGFSRLPTAFELSDGQHVTVRTTRRSDASLIQEMYGLLSPRTRRLRYHAYTAELPLDKAIMMSEFDPERQACLVAVHEDGGTKQIIGHAQYARPSSRAVEAETAIVIRDDFQGLGLGSHMLAVLLSQCRDQNINRVFGWVLSQNRHMLHLYKRTELPIDIQHHSGEMLVTLHLSPLR